MEAPENIHLFIFFVERWIPGRRKVKQVDYTGMFESLVARGCANDTYLEGLCSCQLAVGWPALVSVVLSVLAFLFSASSNMMAIAKGRFPTRTFATRKQGHAAFSTSVWTGLISSELLVFCSYLTVESRGLVRARRYKLVWFSVCMASFVAVDQNQ